jgi:hypothetical protein
MTRAQKHIQHVHAVVVQTTEIYSTLVVVAKNYLNKRDDIYLKEKIT